MNTTFSNITMSLSSLLIFTGGGGMKILNISDCKFSQILDFSKFAKNTGKTMIKISNIDNIITFSSIDFTNLMTSIP